MLRKRVVFLDRDGVINEARHHESGDARNYVTKWEDFEWIPGSKEALVKLYENDYEIVIVINQACVGKGIVKWFGVATIMEELRISILRAAKQPHNMSFLYYICPHTEEENCSCRKPKPGMIYAAAFNHNLSLEEAWMVGDGYNDILAGWTAGIQKLIRIDPDKTSIGFPPMEKNLCRGVRIPNLSLAVDYILEQDKNMEENDVVNGD